MSCLHKNIFGEPNKGIHGYRLGGFAIVDIVLTILGSFIMSRIFGLNFLPTLIILFLLGIILHHVFCVNTALDVILFAE